MPGHDAVVHFAAESHVDRSIEGAATFVVTNVLGTQTLLDAAHRHGVGRFLHVSTDEVYGSIETGSWTEDWPLSPNSPYSAAKAGSDLIALAYHRTHKLDVVGHPMLEQLRPVSVSGEGRSAVRDQLARRPHGAALRRRWQHPGLAARGRPLPGHPAGADRWPVRRGVPHRRRCELTNKELTGRLLDACGVGWEKVVQVEDRKGHDRRYSLDITKISHELGYAPRYSFEDGLAETIAWYRDNRAWWEPLKGDK